MIEKPSALPAVILAAGASRRLGQPKQLLHLPESPAESLLERTLSCTLAASFHPVFVVLGAQAAHIESAAQLSKATIVRNPDWQQGMTSSIRSGVLAAIAACPETTGLLLLVCDQPALTADHLQALLAAHHQHPHKIIASRYANRPGVPILAPRSFFPDLLALTGDTGAREILRAEKNNLIEIPLPHGEWDIDAPEDVSAPQPRAT